MASKEKEMLDLLRSKTRERRIKWLRDKENKDRFRTSLANGTTCLIKRDGTGCSIQISDKDGKETLSLTGGEGVGLSGTEIQGLHKDVIRAVDSVDENLQAIIDDLKTK